MDFTGPYADGRERLTALLSEQWMRAELQVRTSYPGEIPVLSETRGLPWGEKITGKWICDSSALRGDAWPGVQQVTSVAQTLLIFNNSVKSVALGTDSDTLAKLVGGSMVDPVGLSRLLQCLGRACTARQEPGVSDSEQVNRSRSLWRAVMDMSRLCRKRFLRNTKPLPEDHIKWCSLLVQKIENTPSKLYFTDLVREAIPSCQDDGAARLIALEALTTSRAVISGATSTASYITNIQAARHVNGGRKGAVVVDDGTDGRQPCEYSPWVSVLSDGTVCVLGPDMSWAIRWDHQICILGNLNTIYAPLTPAQMSELSQCPKGRWWPTEIRRISKFTLQNLANLGRLVESVPQIAQDLREELDEAYAVGCDEFSGRSITAANRALQRLRDHDPTAWDMFVSRNMTVRTVLGFYEGTPTARVLAALLSERLIVGISSTSFRVSSDVGSRALVIRGTGAPEQRGVLLMQAGVEERSGLPLPELVEGLGASEPERRWLYAGLRIVEKRFNHVIAGNCLTALLDMAEAPRLRVVLPVNLGDFPGILPFTDSAKLDRRTPYWRKRLLEVRPVREYDDVAEASVEGTDVG